VLTHRVRVEAKKEEKKKKKKRNFVWKIKHACGGQLHLFQSSLQREGKGVSVSHVFGGGSVGGGRAGQEIK